MTTALTETDDDDSVISMAREGLGLQILFFSQLFVQILMCINAALYLIIPG